jgi:hypothetical protein
VSEDPIGQELTQMTGDPAVARAIKNSLTRLRDGASTPELAEMARDLLDGRTTLREVTRSGVYTRTLLDASTEARHEIDRLSPEEIQQLADESRSQLQQQQRSAGDSS